MSSVLILEGVTGAGKTSVLRAMESCFSHRPSLIPEEDTLGDLMNQVRNPAWRERPRFEALDAVLARIERHRDEGAAGLLLVERFHLTAYALFPRWELLDQYDERLEALDASLVLLTFPSELAETRSIERPDRLEWAQDMDAWYGSREAAIEAVRWSQAHRWDGLKKTRLPFLHLDTRRQDWSRYARAIKAFVKPPGAVKWT
ncbi:MAG: chloramphenicol phosphotransferase CPT family protein [Myxococcales bacterium]|nr:chloramphenicol phosphotransferase CPT family protein [Myxococcales bacterium]